MAHENLYAGTSHKQVPQISGNNIFIDVSGGGSESNKTKTTMTAGIKSSTAKTCCKIEINCSKTDCNCGSGTENCPASEWATKRNNNNNHTSNENLLSGAPKVWQSAAAQTHTRTDTDVSETIMCNRQMLLAANGQMGSFGNNKCGNTTKSNMLHGQHSSGICGAW